MELSHYVDKLKPGQRIRVEHECGEGEAAMVSRDEDGSVRFYCHRCGDKDMFRPVESLADKAARLQREQDAEWQARASVTLPEPRVYNLSEWPPADALWFYKMGMSQSRIAKLGLYWCPTLGRVVLPITDSTGQVVYWTARSRTRTPKWTGPAIAKDGLTARYGKGDVIVLTEDPLSAFKVGLVTEAWSLLGTKLHVRVVSALLADPRPVVTWLDDDKGRAGGVNPGQDAARKIRAKLRALGKQVHNVMSDRDPKMYSKDQIQEKLHDALQSAG